MNKSLFVFLSILGTTICTGIAIATSSLKSMEKVAGNTITIQLVPILNDNFINVGLVLLVFSTIIVSIVVFVVLTGKKISYKQIKPKRRFPLRWAFLIILSLLLLFIITAFFLSLFKLPETKPQSPPLLTSSEELVQENIEEPLPLIEQPEISIKERNNSIVLLIAIVVIIGFIILIAIRLFRLSEESKPDQEELPEELRVKLQEATQLGIELISRETDFRRAVVGCWIYLENTFSRYNYSVQEHQTPTEYIQKLIERIRSLPAESLTKLTICYETARFSIHPITKHDRNTALACLKDINRYFRNLSERNTYG